VTFTGNVGSDFDPIRETDTSDLAQSRIRFFRGHGTNDRTNTALLGRALGLTRAALLFRVQRILQGGRLAFLIFGRATFSNQLVYCWHLFASVTTYNFQLFNNQGHQKYGWP
jgi:hypothetical protein